MPLKLRDRPCTRCGIQIMQNYAELRLTTSEGHVSNVILCSDCCVKFIEDPPTKDFIQPLMDALVVFTS